jgi:hypothetical protein
MSDYSQPIDIEPTSQSGNPIVGQITPKVLALFDPTQHGTLQSQSQRSPHGQDVYGKVEIPQEAFIAALKVDV